MEFFLLKNGNDLFDTSLKAFDSHTNLRIKMITLTGSLAIVTIKRANGGLYAVRAHPKNPDIVMV